MLAPLAGKNTDRRIEILFNYQLNIQVSIETERHISKLNHNIHNHQQKNVKKMHNWKNSEFMACFEEDMNMSDEEYENLENEEINSSFDEFIDYCNEMLRLV